MANTRVQSFFVLTLLQLCRTQTSNNVSESWYLANLINDSFQLKSISEIFSTESPFSTTNPIVLWSRSTSMSEPTLSSTLPPPTSFQYTSTYNSPSPTPATIDNVGSTLSTGTVFSSRSPQREITQLSEQTKLPFQVQQTTNPISNLEQQTVTAQLPQSSVAGQFLIPAQNVATLQPISSSTPRTLSGSFVIYQNVAVNNDPGQEPSLQGGLFGTAFPQQMDSSRGPGSTVALQPTSTAFPSSVWTSRGPTTVAPTVQALRTGVRTSLGPNPLPFSERPTTRSIPTKFEHPNPNHRNRTQFNNFGALPLKIRVVGPRGAITNVNINPRIVAAPTTTTKRPTTTRTRKTPKPKRNTYEACLSGCKARRDPICAVPLSATKIEPEKLKGFPSICHMACFNSYKKDTYEKLMDGRCGRLRTRIHTFDSNTKLKREELNKAQYFVDGGDETVVEVSPLYRK